MSSILALLSVHVSRNIAKAPLPSRISVAITKPQLTLRPGLHPRILHRHFVSDVFPAVLIPPAVFAGLTVALWTWKCVMMVIFQNKIIYMPFLPPNARTENLDDYARRCSPVAWREQRIQAADGTEIALCVGKAAPVQDVGVSTANVGKHIIIIYCQGNASSLPPRIPYLSDILKSLDTSRSSERCDVEYTIVGVSYRGFWTSKGRPSQRGIILDVAAALRWVSGTYNMGKRDVQVVFWGQSIGAGIACTAAAAYSRTASAEDQRPAEAQPELTGLLLETPFTSLRSMLATIYPQKWVPYQYLWPFLRSWWDSKAALHEIAQQPAKRRPRVLILQAGKDELVPRAHGLELEGLCKKFGIIVERREVAGALHTDCMTRGEGKRFVIDYLRRIANE